MMDLSSIAMPTIFPVTSHTDFVGAGSVFIAIDGYAENGVAYIKTAVEKGARTIVVHNDAVLDVNLIAMMEEYSVTIMRVENTRKALADMSAEYAYFPAKKLKIIGLTGTKGKTTTSFLLEHILMSAGYKTALISSARNRIRGAEFSAPLTTPQPDYLQQFLKLCVDSGVEYVVMEIAAQALSLYRVKGIELDGIIFTNFSHEHLEFYSTLDDYFKAKCLIFDMVKPDAPCIINADDDHGQRLLAIHSNAKAYGFSCKQVDYYSEYIVDPVHDIQLRIIDKKSHTMTISCPVLFGAYNGYNVLAASAMALKLGVSEECLKSGLVSFRGVPGRLQQNVLPNGARSFIDYAHNPESFRAVLSTLRLLTHQLIVVFGAGGGRDKIKRPVMGEVAATIADIVILTSDNPRLENPVDIIHDIRTGVSSSLDHKVRCIVDRKEAIEYAYSQSSDGSIIALLGKGPDEYQMIGSTKYYFSEQQIIQQLS